MADNHNWWTTRQAAAYLNLSTVAMVHKKELLGAVHSDNGYLWSPDKVREYARSVAGKSLNDPNRNRAFERD